MPIAQNGLVRPHVVEMTKREDNPYVAEFRVQPLERGYGYTMGNAMRRMLLSSLSGAAVWAFRLEGVVHEHQTLPGVAEDIHQIIQRLKALTLVLADGVQKTVLTLKVSRPGPIRAKDLEPNSAVEIVHPEHVLFTLQQEREVKGELYVKRGRGYVEASQHPKEKEMPVDVVTVDSLYNPVRRANFAVRETRVGQRTDFDSLVLSVETNGAISPEDAVTYAAALLQDHFHYFLDFGRVPQFPTPGAEEGEETAGSDTVQLRDLLARSIDDCGLSVRSINSLKNAGIMTLGDLVRYSRGELLDVKNVGEKALEEIESMLRTERLSLGTKLEEGVETLAATGESATAASSEAAPEA